MFEKSISIVIFGAKNCQKMPKSNNFSFFSFICWPEQTNEWESWWTGTEVNPWGNKWIFVCVKGNVSTATTFFLNSISEGGSLENKNMKTNGGLSDSYPKNFLVK